MEQSVLTGDRLEVEPRDLVRSERDVEGAKAAVQFAGGGRADQCPHREWLVQHPGEGDVDLFAALGLRKLGGATLALEIRVGVPAADELGILEPIRGGTRCEEPACLARPREQRELMLGQPATRGRVAGADASF